MFLFTVLQQFLFSLAVLWFQNTKRFVVLTNLKVAVFSEIQVSTVITLFRTFRMVGIQLFCKVKHKPSVLFYNASGFIISTYKSCWRQLSYCGLHIRVVLVFGKNQNTDCNFLAYFCVILRFSDPLICWESWPNHEIPIISPCFINLCGKTPCSTSSECLGKCEIYMVA